MSTYENQTENLPGGKLGFKDVYGATIVSCDMADPTSFDKAFKLLSVARESNTLSEGRFLQYARIFEKAGYSLPKEIAEHPLFQKVRKSGKRLTIEHIVEKNKDKVSRAKETLRRLLAQDKINDAIEILESQSNTLERIASNYKNAA